MNILLGISGSVAAIKAVLLKESLQKVGNVKLVLTDKAEFFTKKCLKDVYYDRDEWKWDEIGDPIIHIDLKDWADILVIAPLSANTLAKINHGLCDNLLTCIYRAWSVHKPIIVAPAMNTDMWNHPLTKEQLYNLSCRHLSSFTLVEPVEKMLACGVEGVGAMAPIESIVEAVKTYSK